MLSRFGQECLLRGYTLNSFEFDPDDDDNFTLVIKDEDYLDVGWENECLNNPSLRGLSHYNEKRMQHLPQDGGYVVR